MVIENFTNIESLNIKNNLIKELPNLLEFKNLNYEYLKIDWNDIIQIKGMKGFGLIKNMIKSLKY